MNADTNSTILLFDHELQLQWTYLHRNECIGMWYGQGVGMVIIIHSSGLHIMEIC